jgi:hypothetical protein
MKDRVVKGICEGCKKTVTLELPIGYSINCETCTNYFHSCIQCKHFDIRKNNCSSLTAEPTKDPRSKNFCDEFSFSEIQKNEKSKLNENNIAKDKLETLFKNSDQTTENQKPKKSINDLFKS